MTIDKKHKGIVIPAVTPLSASHALDHEAVNKMFNYFYAHGVHPFILGTTGEAASLSLSFKKEFLQLAGHLKNKGGVLYAGISSNALDESVTMAKYSFDQGVDVVVATLPSYYTVRESAMLKYFEQLAEQVNGPLMIYNIPATTYMSIPLGVIDQLSHHPNIVGIKDSERSEERLRMSVHLWKDRTDFSHFLGWAAKSAEAILMGSDGLVPSTGNFHPKLYIDLYRAAKENNRERALELQHLSDELGNMYQAGRTLGESLWALKVLMKRRGLCQSHVMPPIYEQSIEEERKVLEQFNRDLRLDSKIS